MDLRHQLEQHLGSAFALGRELGGGGMSRVFVADEVRLGRRVAIKVLSPELAQGLNADRFEREILLAASLQQANIVPVLAAGDVGGLPYFTMPFVEGESLRHRLRDGHQLPITDILAIVKDVAKALAYAHSRGVVHRDIKPDNVLLSGGTAVVTDFGIAKALSASRTDGGGNATLTSVGTSIGTPAYMAPEQIAGDPNIDHRVDLYALGCMTYELLTGRAPFADRTPQRMLAAHLSEKPAPVASLRPDCPAPLVTLVNGLLQKDPVDRTGSATEVLRSLEAVSTTSASSPSLGAPGTLGKVLVLYTLATLAVAILAKAAVVGIGLPSWVFPGAVAVMLLGLPVLLATAYVKRVARRAAIASPTLTPGGSMAARVPSGTMATIALKAHPHLSWRKTARGGAIAMSLFVLAVVGYMAMRQFGIGPAATLFTAGTLRADDRIVLADFTAAREDSSLAPIVGEAVRAAMSQSKSVRVMEPADVATVLSQMERERSSAIDLVTAQEIATRSGASAVLSGRLARAGTGYAVSMNLTAANGGALLASVQGTARDVSDLLPVVDDLSRDLRGKIGESLKSVQRSIALEEATTTSLEALRKYTEAVRANDIDADYDAAIKAAREAVALDSTFALAWRKLSAAIQNSRGSLAARDSALERAAQFSDKLPERERLLVLGALYQHHLTRNDRAKAIESYRTVYQLDSSHALTASQLSILFAARSQWDSALRYGKRLLTIAPTPASVARFAHLSARAGDFATATHLLDSLEAASPEVAKSGAFLGARAYVFLQTDHPDSVAAVTQRIAALAPGSLPSALELLGFAYETSGQLTRGAATWRARDSVVASRGGPPPMFGLSEAQHEITIRGRPEAGVRGLDALVASREWTATHPSDRAYLEVATLYAAAGRADRARQMLAAFKAESPERAATAEGQALENLLLGDIALAEKRTDEAVRRYRAEGTHPDGLPRGCVMCTNYRIGRAYDLAGQADSTIAYYTAYLKSPVQNADFTRSMAHAAVLKRLGELYDARDDRANAAKYYERFVGLWKNADADLQPSVASVRKRIDELKRAGG